MWMTNDDTLHLTMCNLYVIGCLKIETDITRVSGQFAEFKITYHFHYSTFITYDYRYCNDRIDISFYTQV